MFDTKQQIVKPDKNEAGKIQIRLKATEMSIQDLAEGLISGCSFKPALLTGKTSDSWVSQQLFALDFDGGITIEQALKKCQDFNIIPAFAYTSFSHTESHHKFRFVFATEIPITDLRARNVVQRALMLLFKESDQCTEDPARMFYGGLQLIHEEYESVLCPYWLIQKVVLRTKLEHPKNVARKIKSFCEEVGLNMINNNPDVRLEIEVEDEKNYENDASSIYKYRACGETTRFNFNITQVDGATKFNEKKKKLSKSKVKNTDVKRKILRNFEFDKLEENCRLYRDVIGGSRWGYHQEIFGMATNLVHVEGGEKRLLEAIKHNHYNKNRINLEHTIKSTRIYNYKPMQCRNHCPFIDACNNKGLNMLHTVDNKRHSIRKIKSSTSAKSLEEAEFNLADAIKVVLEAKNDDIYLIQGETGLGKTQALKELPNYNKMMISYPNHRLGTDIVSRLEIKDAIHLKKLNLKDETVMTEYIDAIKKGNFKRAYFILDNYRNKLLINGDRQEIMTEVGKINEYLENSNEAQSTNKLIYCTHEKALHLENNKIETYIFDEDILLSSLIKTVPVDLNTLEIIQRLAKKENCLSISGGLLNLTEKTKDAINSPGMIFKRENLIYKEKELNVLVDKYSDQLDTNIRNLVEIAAVCSNSKGEVLGVIKKCLPNKKCIILSATANQEVYKGFFKDRNVHVINIGDVERRGKIIHHYGSFSRTAMKGKLEKIIKQVQEEAPNVKNMITFAKYERHFENVGYNTICHYGSCQGIDGYKGQDLIVLGTPHVDQRVYGLFATLLGEEFQISDEMKYRNMIRNGFEFYMPTYDTNSIMQEIQLYLIESELYQAIGRARVLRTDATVHVFSSIPPRGAILYEQKYEY